MIAVDAEPIGNRNPLPRVSLHPVRQPGAEDFDAPMSICQAVEASVRATAARLEADRVWKLVVQSSEAGGPVAPTTPPDVPVIDSVYVAPDAGPIVYDGVYGEWVDTAPSEYCSPTEDAA